MKYNFPRSHHNFKNAEFYVTNTTYKIYSVLISLFVIFVGFSYNVKETKIIAMMVLGWVMGRLILGYFHKFEIFTKDQVKEKPELKIFQNKMNKQDRLMICTKSRRYCIFNEDEIIDKGIFHHAD